MELDIRRSTPFVRQYAFLHDSFCASARSKRHSSAIHGARQEEGQGHIQSSKSQIVVDSAGSCSEPRPPRRRPRWVNALLAKSPSHPDEGGVIVKRKDVTARRGLKEARSKDGSRWTRTGYRHTAPDERAIGHEVHIHQGRWL